MNYFNTIGIGIAFSPTLKANLYEASRLALFFKSKLVLIHVGIHSHRKEKDIQKILSPFIEKNLDFEIVFKVGDPAEVILNVVQEKRLDLIILGALKRENILKYYVGSIARKITRNASCSVLLLIKPSVERVPCKHVVINGLKDEKATKTISYGFFVGSKLGASKVTVVEEITQQEVAVNVNDDRSLRRANIVKERISIREKSRVIKILEETPEEFKKNIKIKTQPIFGRRGYSIGHYAEVVRADLLVTNAPDKLTFLDRLFPHDIEHILTELPTDVLIIR